ncbi:MAG: PaaI family thioesterase [Promethearchaeota archaeon]
MSEGKLPPPPIGELMGIRLVEVGDGRIVMEMDADEKHWNPMKTLHGGVLCDIADAAMGASFLTTLEDDETYTTVDLNIKFLRPVITGRLRATANVVKRGKRLGYMECEVTKDGELVAKATSSCIILN